VAITRLNSQALANLRKSTFTVTATGKFVKEEEVFTSGKSTGINSTSTSTSGTTTTTTSGTSGISRLVITGDTSSTTVTTAQTGFSIIGGRSISTAVQGSQLIVNLNEAITFTQAVINSTSTLSPLIIKNSSNQVVFSISPQGIPVLVPKTVLPAPTSGMIYISGSAETQEGYYVGFPDPTGANATTGDGVGNAGS
jgi:hypothetical protein